MAGAGRTRHIFFSGRFLAAGVSFALSAAAQTLDTERIFDERNLEPVRELLDIGDYGNVAKVCTLFIERGQPSPEWWIMRLKADVVLGEVQDIVKTSEEALKRHKENLHVLMACHEALSAYGKTELAAKVLQQVNIAAKAKPASQRTSHDLS